MKNHWLDQENCEKIEFVDSDFIYEEDYNTQVAKEKNEIKDVLNKYKDHCWFSECMEQLGYLQFEKHDNYSVSVHYHKKNDRNVSSTENYKGFPPSDETSIQAGCCGNFSCNCSCNLGIYSLNQCVQNEVMQVYADAVDVTTYLAYHTPILPGSMTGTVGWNGCDVFTFTVNSSGMFDFKNIKNEGNQQSLEELTSSSSPIYTYYDEVYSWETSLNCQTGILTLHHHSTCTPTVTVSYEYNMGV